MLEGKWLNYLIHTCAIVYNQALLGVRYGTERYFKPFAECVRDKKNTRRLSEAEGKSKCKEK